MAFSLDSIRNRASTTSNKDGDLTRPFVPVFGQQLVDGYERHWENIHRGTDMVARYARYANQQQLPLHDWWAQTGDEFRAFQKEAATMQTEVLPAVAALQAHVGQLAQHMTALEEVLMILIENQEERARQDAERKATKELADQKARFIATYKEHETKYLGLEFQREKHDLEAALKVKEKQLKQRLEADMRQEKLAVAEQLERAKESVQLRAQERAAAIKAEAEALMQATRAKAAAATTTPPATASTAAAASAPSADATPAPPAAAIADTSASSIAAESVPASSAAPSTVAPADVASSDPPAAAESSSSEEADATSAASAAAAASAPIASPGGGGKKKNTKTTKGKNY